MKKIISTVILVASLGLVACGDGSRSELITQNYIVAEVPTTEQGYCYIRARPVGQPESPTQLFQFRQGNSDTIIRRAYSACRAYRVGDLFVRSSYVRVSANKGD